MKISILGAAVIIALFFTDVRVALAIAVLNTSTMDAAELDFDGSGVETNGDLSPLTSKVFVLSGGDIPGGAEFADISSITIMFSGSVGTTLSAKTGFQSGIGLTYPGETGEAGAAIRGLSPGSSPTEILSIEISSTSTAPGKEVLISGVDFTNWRNQFPLSQATFTGATVGGGSSTFIGSDGGPFGVQFDNPSSSFTIQSTLDSGPGDSFRLESLSLTTGFVIPEPSSLLLLGFGALGLIRLTRRRRLRA